MLEIGDQIYRLGTAYHNFYVVVDGGKATVVDAGASKEWPKLVAGLTSVGLAPADVEAILVTHAHPDHIGFGREAADAGVDVRVHGDDEARALGTYEGRGGVGVSDLPLLRIATWRFLVVLMRAGVRKQPPLEAVTTIEDGETLELPGSPVAVHTPGHTEGHVVFHFPGRRALFTGDALATRDVLGSPRVHPQMLPEAFHADPGLARQSLKRIASLEADVVLPGHGDPFHGSPAEAVTAIQ